MSRFWFSSTMSSTVRDALACAMAQLVFSKDGDAVTSLFSGLDLIQEDTLLNAIENQALTDALAKNMGEAHAHPNVATATNASSYINSDDTTPTADAPMLKFDKSLDRLAHLVPRFKFQSSPHLTNNARVLGTLEGIARTFNLNFHEFSMIHPHALNRTLKKPTTSVDVDKRLQQNDTN